MVQITIVKCEFHIYTSENNWSHPNRVGAPGCLHRVEASQEGDTTVLFAILVYYYMSFLLTQEENLHLKEESL